MERQLLSCLLTLIDQLHMDSETEEHFVFLIGATNRPNALDLSLRRPGRFDVEIEIGRLIRYELVDIQLMISFTDI